MKPFRRMVLVASAFLLLHGSANLAHAGWNNVFQVCCHQRSTVSYYAPAACCPQPVCCTTQYVQRCYYQPVTAYQTRSYYEPVTSYQTSYYYEPVTSYRYSCYFDPCTCSYQQVAVPTTSYRLRAQSCPVTSWVQRCASVPVTTYQQAFYWEPVTSCTSAAVAAPVPATPAPALAAPVAPAAPSPGVMEHRSSPTPGVSERPGGQNGGGSNIQRYYVPDPMPPASGSSLRPGQPAPPPRVRLDRIVTLPQSNNVEGQVFRGWNAPQPGARLLFVSTARVGNRQTATTDAAGQFRVTLGAGEWLVYLHGTDGRPIFHSKLEVRENETRKVTLVSR